MPVSHVTRPLPASLDRLKGCRRFLIRSPSLQFYATHSIFFNRPTLVRACPKLVGAALGARAARPHPFVLRSSSRAGPIFPFVQSGAQRSRRISRPSTALPTKLKQLPYAPNLLTRTTAPTIIRTIVQKEETIVAGRGRCGRNGRNGRKVAGLISLLPPDSQSWLSFERWQVWQKWQVFQKLSRPLKIAASINLIQANSASGKPRPLHQV